MIQIKVKMWLIVFLYVSPHIVLNYALINNPELLSSYAFKDKYIKFLRDTNTDLDDNCPGFNCNSSGLSSVQINDIIQKENNLRNSYAEERNITNLYSVNWDTHLAAHAQERVHLGCVLPGTGNKVIYERVTNQWYPKNYTLWNGQSNHSLEDYPTAVEVVIGSRSFPLKEQVDLQHTISEFIETFNKIDNISNPLERRGGTVHMGCSYLVTANTSHNTDYMVCLYGFLYFDPDTAANKYKSEIGTPCSKCEFYKVIEEIPETHGQQWKCDRRYPFTCNNLSKRGTYDTIMNPNRFDCHRKIHSKLKKPLYLPSQEGLSPMNISRPIEYIRVSESGTGKRTPTIGGFFTLLCTILLIFLL
ncbi:uncharacterized protein LOC135831510 [Planococcus citri]|uniref:uncharacterized protein LOC135831510 n=1 Tax=Planococcus citri TaxID=170843 RepID=UPI0031F80EA0